MTPLGRRWAMILCGLVVLAALLNGCQPAAPPVSTVTPGTVVHPSPSITPEPTGTFTPPSTPTLIPSPIYSETPVSTPTEAAAPRSGPFRLVKPVDQVLPGTVENLVSTADGTLWLVTDQGVARLVDNTWKVYLTSLPGRLAGIDSTRRVWVVNEGATEISAWDGYAWTAYNNEAGWTPLADDFYQDVHGGQSDLQGGVWFATSQDVRVFNGTRWVVNTPQEMGMGAPAYDDLMTSFEVTISSSGVVWVSECDWGGPGPFGGRGIRWFEKGAWRGAALPVESGCATVVAEDSIGRVWAGVDNSLWRYNPASDTWAEFPSPESPISEMRFGFIDSLVVDSQDAVWPVLVLCGGASCYGNSVLYHFQDGLWTQVGEAEEYDASFWLPISDASGLPWLYWAGGIYRINENSPVLVSPLAARFAAVDDSGRMWLVAPYNNHDALWILDDETRS